MSEKNADEVAFTGPDVKDVRTLKALAHPLRMQILEYLGDYEKATSTTLAEHLGESTGQTSYHLRQLAKYGFVEEAEGKGNARERWWRSSGYSVRPEDVQPLARQSPLLQTIAERQIVERFEKLATFQGGVPNEEPAWVEASSISVSSSTLTPEQLKALRNEVWKVTQRHLEAAEESHSQDGDQLRRRVRIHFDAFPLPAEGNESAD